MQTCYNCGKQVDDNVLICPDCGALVKRYGRPEPQTPAPDAPQPQIVADMQRAYGGGQPYDPAQSARGAVRVGADGRRHFSGAMCLWLVLCAIGAGYLAAGFGSALLIHANRQYFFDTLRMLPEMAPVINILTILMQDVDAFHTVYVLRTVFFAGKCAALIWLLVSKRKIAFYAAAVLSVLAAAMLIGSGGLGSIIYALDMLITWLLLRRSWKLLR